MTLNDPLISSAADGLVWVYGTLRRGGSNDLARLHPGAEFIATATVPGTLYDLGAYPGAIFLRAAARAPAASATLVTGEIHRITPEIERALDVLEGVEADDTGEYVKCFIDVAVGAMTVRCLAYEIHPSRTKERPVIACGDWLKHRW